MKYLVFDSNRAHFLGSYVSDNPLTTGWELLSPEKNPRLMEVIRIFECPVGGPGVEEFNGEIGYELIVDGGTYLIAECREKKQSKRRTKDKAPLLASPDHRPPDP